MNKILSTWRLFPKWNILTLLLVSILITWVLVFFADVKYMHQMAPELIEALGYGKIFTSTFDATLIIWCVLVFILFGVLAFSVALYKTNENSYKKVQLVWCVLIVGLNVLANVFD